MERRHLVYEAWLLMRLVPNYNSSFLMVSLASLHWVGGWGQQSGSHHQHLVIMVPLHWIVIATISVYIPNKEYFSLIFHSHFLHLSLSAYSIS